MAEGHRQRLKSRFLQSGLDGFNEINTLELLLFYTLPRQDTNPTAHKLLDRF
jgi:DNA repair protein RadC